MNFKLTFNDNQPFEGSTACLRSASLLHPVAGGIAMQLVPLTGPGNGNDGWSHSGEGIA